MSEENTMPDSSLPHNPGDPSLEQTLKRCRPEVIKAARDYQTSKDPKLLPTIVIGVLERFIEPERRQFLQVKNQSELKLQADLGMDSLVMVEVVMTLEEILGQQIPDTELRGLFTIGDTLAYVQAKATGAALPTPPERLLAEMLPMLLPGETILVSDVILREKRAEAVYSGTEQTPEGLLKASQQLASLWSQRKNSPQTLSPKLIKNRLDIDSSIPVQLRLDNESSWKACYLQTGKEPVLLGTL